MKKKVDCFWLFDTSSAINISIQLFSPLLTRYSRLPTFANVPCEYHTAQKSAKTDFAPLRVDYMERFSAAGMTSGGYNKRDGRYISLFLLFFCVTLSIVIVRDVGFVWSFIRRYLSSHYVQVCAGYLEHAVSAVISSRMQFETKCKADARHI